MKDIKSVPKEEKEKFKKYFFDYLRELSQFDPNVKFDRQGTPIYKWLDLYWEDDDRFPFMLLVGGQFAGLALIRELDTKNYEVAEFYVVPEFRKDHNALDFATKVIKSFDGDFVFSTRFENQRAVRFWDKFVLQFSFHEADIDNSCKHWHIKT